jgi:hypothetical protein
MHLHGPAKKPNRKTHLKKQNFMFNIRNKLFYTHLFSRESKRCLITCAPTPPPALVMIHLFDPLGKLSLCEKGFPFFY